MEAQAPATPSNAPAPEVKRKINKRFIIIFALLIVGGGAFGISKYLHAQKHEETDDAQVDANISPVIPRVGGYIQEVRVRDNQEIKAGDTLVILDARDMQIRLEQAEAALLQARSSLGVAEATITASQAGVASTRSNIATINAQIEAAKVNQWRAHQDYERYANLVKDHSITQQQFEQAEAAKQAADRQVDILVEQRNAAQRQTAAANSQSMATGRQVPVANAGIRQREADVAAARLNLSYTVITAPADGRVSRVTVQKGQLVQPGQQLFSIVPEENLWVTANFKETQLRKMHEGQPVQIYVDALGGAAFDGIVSSLSPATGSRFSILPPDNASGNFIKVVQRVPVRIAFVGKDPRIAKLRPGMNVTADVHIGE